MTNYNIACAGGRQEASSQPNIIRHSRVCERLSVSSAKLFDMIAKGQFPKPFIIIPGGRAVGWLEGDVDRWILGRMAAGQGMVS
jgi:prophage regulatory protein